MAGFDYSRMQGTASRLMSRFAQGTVTLSRTVPGEPDPETPWLPGTPVTTAYTLDATVKGVSAQFIDGSTILATDLEVTASVMGTDESGAQVSIEIDLATDTLSIDGQAVTIIRDLSVPAAGVKVVLKYVVRA